MTKRSERKKTYLKTFCYWVIYNPFLKHAELHQIATGQELLMVHQLLEAQQSADWNAEHGVGGVERAPGASPSKTVRISARNVKCFLFVW